MMKKIIVLLLFFWIATRVYAFGEPGQWSSGWGQGVSEYTVVMQSGDSLYIACSEDQPVSMTLSLKGKKYGSYSQQGFDLIINGTEVQTPYDTDSRVGSNNFTYAWDALRKATRLQAKTTDGQTVDLPTKGVATALPARGTSEFDCKTGLDF
ncbi:hypothetical protein ACUNEV_25610 [Serratia sp. IR-2025]